MDVPTTASDYQANIDCATLNSVVDCKNDLIVYPNPASSTITLKGVLIKNNNYKIISIDGKVLKKEILKTSNIDISDLKKGVYFLEYDNNRIKLIIN